MAEDSWSLSCPLTSLAVSTTKLTVLFQTESIIVKF